MKYALFLKIFLGLTVLVYFVLTFAALFRINAVVPTKTSLTVTTIFENSIAQKAGLQVGDVIERVNGQNLSLMRAIRSTRLAELEVKRGDETFYVQLDRREQLQLYGLLLDEQKVPWNALDYLDWLVNYLFYFLLALGALLVLLLKKRRFWMLIVGNFLIGFCVYLVLFLFSGRSVVGAVLTIFYFILTISTLRLRHRLFD